MQRLIKLIDTGKKGFTTTGNPKQFNQKINIIHMNHEKSPCLFSESEGIRVVWGISHGCNLKCKHCAVEGGEGVFLAYESAEAYKEAIDSMKEGGVDAIYISGGEPLLHPHIYDIVRHAKDNDIYLSVGTNGYGLRDKEARELAKAGVDKVYVSIDHYEREKHDYLRSGEAFENAINAVRYLKNYGIPVRVDAIIWKENWDKLEDFVYFCMKHGVDEVIFAWPVKVGRAAKNAEIIIPPENEYLSVGKTLQGLKEKYEGTIDIKYHRFEPFGNDANNCKGGQKILYVDATGRLSPCFWMTCIQQEFFTEETVFNSGFRDLLNSSEIVQFREMKEERAKEYGPGCPALCAIENGDVFSRDPLFIE